MPKQRVYYDYVDGNLVPFWYVLTFRPNEIPWEDETYYFEVISPFEYFDRDDFDDSVLSTSIYIEDLLTNNLQESNLGLNLDQIKERILRHGVEPWEVRQLIIQLPDIEEVLKLLPNERKASFILT
ncbi:hypothetical protein [Metabacillus sp. FJAT-53654]|uniref:Uncharacterized protein n=1 Tax=Metabacillus rhizosphaerae TaxID=3117747 RepID=A0ABZ2MY71_9BACI